MANSAKAIKQDLDNTTPTQGEPPRTMAERLREKSTLSLMWAYKDVDFDLKTDSLMMLLADEATRRDEERTSLRQQLAARDAEIATANERMSKLDAGVPVEVEKTLRAALKELEYDLHSSNTYALKHPEEVKALRDTYEWLDEQAKGEGK